MRILMAMHSLAMGGAEKFFTNLATALSERHDVVCYIPLHRLSDASMAARLDQLPVTSLPCFTPLTYSVFYKLTLLVKRHAPGFDPESRMHTRRLCALHTRHSFDVANAHLMPAARQLCNAFKDQLLPITKSDHGDTAHFDIHEDSVIFERLDALICPAEANTIRTQSLPWRPRCQITTIPYGHLSEPTAVTSSPLAPFDGITFGMVARGVEDKGWREAVAAARALRSHSATPLRLVLVGEGPALDALRAKLSADDASWIILAGHQTNPEAWIRGFDVGILPTCLRGESLPNSIIEYLACGKPVIATDVGGIPEMLGKAGILIPLAANGRADVDELARAMRHLCQTSAHATFALAANEAYARYDLEACATAYESLFTSLCAGGR